VVSRECSTQDQRLAIAQRFDQLAEVYFKRQQRKARIRVDMVMVVQTLRDHVLEGRKITYVTTLVRNSKLSPTINGDCVQVLDGLRRISQKLMQYNQQHQQSYPQVDVLWTDQEVRILAAWHQVSPTPQVL